MSILLFLFEECFADEFRSDGQCSSSNLDVVYPQVEFVDVKMEVGETKPTASTNDVCDTLCVETDKVASTDVSCKYKFCITY